jgi:hypothetical protein
MTKVPTSPLSSPQRAGFLSTLDPLQSTSKVNLTLHYESSNEGNTNFLGLNHKLQIPWAMHCYLRYESLKVTNTSDVVREDDRVLLLE